MEKLSQLIVIEAGNNVTPLLRRLAEALQPFVEAPVDVQSLAEALQPGALRLPQMLFLHTDLALPQGLQSFQQLQAAFPSVPVVIVGNKCDKESWTRFIDAGAEDCIKPTDLTEEYLHKTVALYNRRWRVQQQRQQQYEGLWAALQYSPNVAVQWYNRAGKVVFWNKASERIFGPTAEEAMGKKIDELFAVVTEDDFWLSKIRHLTKTFDHSETLEWPFRYPDGSEGWCISTLFPIPSPAGEEWFACMDVEITERKVAEAALRESRMELEQIYDNNTDLIFLLRAEPANAYRFVSVNRTFAKTVGVRKEDVVGRDVREVLLPENLHTALAKYKQAVDTRQKQEWEETSGCGSGVVVTLISVTPIDWDNGELRLLVVVHNVTDERRTQEALRRSEEKYRLLVEQQADAITVFDDRGRILEVNTSATELLGYSRDELLSMSLDDVLTKEGLQNNPISYGVLKQDASTIKQRTMRRRDGSLVETEAHTKRLWDGHFLTSARDLTERLAVQHQLQKEKQLSDSIINSLPGLFYLFTQEGEYLLWNRQQEVMSGYGSEEIKNMRPLDFFDDDERSIVRESIERVFATGQSSVEAKLLTKQGKKVPCYFTGIAVQYADTTCLLGTGIDLSAMKRLEKELSDQKIGAQKKVMHAMIDAQEKEKANLGLELHDNVNQILSVVKMYLNILHADGPKEGITLPKTIKLLNSAIDEIRGLSHSLAVSYRFEAGLVEALQEMVEKVKLTRDFSISLTTPPGIDDSLSATQKLAVYRIVQEQLSNVMKYAKATDVNVALSTNADDIFLRIDDNGKGFDPARVEKGLGLNNITTRAEALGGKVTIVSAPGAGCHVSVCIPLRQEGE